MTSHWDTFATKQSNFYLIHAYTLRGLCYNSVVLLFTSWSSRRKIVSIKCPELWNQNVSQHNRFYIVLASDKPSNAWICYSNWTLIPLLICACSNKNTPAQPLCPILGVNTYYDEQHTSSAHQDHLRTSTVALMGCFVVNCCFPSFLFNLPSTAKFQLEKRRSHR